MADLFLPMFRKKNKHISYLVLWICFVLQTAAIGHEPKKLNTKEVRPLIPYQEIKLEGDRVLILTHHCTMWDRKCVTQTSADAAIAYARKNKIPIVHLQRDGKNHEDAVYYCNYQPNDSVTMSLAGEIAFKIPSKEVISTGGFFSKCHRMSMLDLLERWKWDEGDRKVTLITSAIYDEASEFYSAHADGLTENEKAKVVEKVRALAKKFGANAVPLSEILNSFPNEESAASHLEYEMNN